MDVVDFACSGNGNLDSLLLRKRVTERKTASKVLNVTFNPGVGCLFY